MSTSNYRVGPLISVVIPVYNEGKKIAIDLDALLIYLTKAEYNFELIVVNDGSYDQTLSILKKYQRQFNLIKVITHNFNQGKGFAVRQGILYSKGDYIIYLDAGLCVPLDNIAKGISYLEAGYDLVIGSRYLQESRILVFPPLYRRLGSFIIRLIVRHFLKISNIRDSQCGFKIFRRKIAQDIFRKQEICGFMFDVELLYLAKQSGYSTKEIPVIWSYDADTRYCLIRSTIQSIYELMKIKVYQFKLKRN